MDGPRDRATRVVGKARVKAKADSNKYRNSCWFQHLPVPLRYWGVQNIRMPRYTPWTKARYEVSPGLKPLGADFGNGDWDAKVFHFGSDVERVLASKREALAERNEKYRQSHLLSSTVARAACDQILGRLGREWPDLKFADDTDPFRLLNALSEAIPEDIAIVSTEGLEDWLAYGCICSPSHWALEEKIGKSFAAMHEPVPGFHRTAAVASKMIDAMVNKGPWVRFVWSIESDNRPNHHPEAPPGWDQKEWWGREFQRKQTLWVRVERQCLIPMPEVQAALFTIGLSWMSGQSVCADESLRVPLLQAILKMSVEERQYKGIDEEIHTVCSLLDAPSVVRNEPQAVVRWVHDELAILE
jgi:dimethylamine monooxygenase subunit A